MAPSRNALADDMIRKERQSALQRAEERLKERETAKWFAPFFSIALAVALLFVGYALWHNEHALLTPASTFAEPR
jgi:hypothetical protein